MGIRARRAATVIACALTAVGAPLVPTAPAVSQTGPTEATAPEDSVVVALRSLGQVNAVLASGEVRVLARGLAEPAGVAVLDDGTVLVAETAANRVSGFGGRLGAAPQTVADVAQPTGLALRSDGTVFVAAAGEIGRVDVSTRQYQTIASGFVSPTTPAVRDGVLYVPDFSTGEVVSVDIASGSRLGTVASGLQSPSGAASGPNLPVFVSEASGNRIVRLDTATGVSTAFATAQGPLQLAIAHDGSSADSWTLIAATAEGLVRLAPDGRVVDRVSLPLTAGAAVAPSAEQGSGEGTTSGSEGDTIVVRDDGGGGLSPLVLIVALVLLAAAAALVATLLLARRARRRERDAEGTFGLATATMTEPGGAALAMNECALEEREVERVEHELRSLSAQLHEARRRLREAIELASRARDRAMRALEVRTSVRQTRLSGEHRVDPYKLDWSQLSFTTDAGREALSAFRHGAIDSAGLRERLTELGELNAVAQIVAEGQRRSRTDPTTPWPEERRAVRDAVAARDELRAHERDAERARVDTAQLEAREREVNEDLVAARKRLDDCRRGHSGPPEFSDF